MKFTLDICGVRKIVDPSENDIREAVLSLNDEQHSAFLVLEGTETNFIQTAGDPTKGFNVEYRNSEWEHQYAATRLFTADEVIMAFTSYCAGATDWKEMAEWKIIFGVEN